MPESKRIEEYEATLPAELEVLWKRWNDGAFAHHSAQLKEFVKQRRESVLEIAGGPEDSPALIRATKTILVKLGTVHHPTEMRDQLHEIRNEIWYHGEKGEFDQERIALNWTTRHAENWRRWRLKEYLFVIDRIAAELLTRLREG